MSIGAAKKTDDGYPILEGTDSSSGLVAGATLTSEAGGHEAVDVNIVGGSGGGGGGAITVADGADTTLGTTTDIAVGDATGTVEAHLRQIAKLLVGINLGQINGSTIAGTNPLPILDGYQPPSTATWTSATSLNTALSVSTAGYDTCILTLVGTGTITAGAVTFEVYDGATWLPVKAGRIESYYTDGSYSLIGAPVASRAWQIPVSGFPNFRCRLSTAIVGAGSMAVTIVTSSAPDTSVVTVGIDPGTYPIPHALQDASSGIGANIIAGDINGLACGGLSRNVTATLTGAQSANALIGGVINVEGWNSIAFSLPTFGTGVSSCYAYGSVDGTNFTLLGPFVIRTGATGTTLSAATIYQLALQGLKNLYVQINQAQTAGSTVLTYNLSTALSSGISLGGSSAQIGSLAAGSAVIGGVTQSVTTSGGVTTEAQVSALTNSAVAIKASAGNLYSVGGYNPNTGACTILVYNVAAGSVVLGTTVPLTHLTIPAGQWAERQFAVPRTFGTAISWAAISGAYSATASTAPSTGLDAVAGYN